jgi:hypothetical protein
MTDSKQEPISGSGEGDSDVPLHSLKTTAALEELDRRAGREYVPMDVFVDPESRNAHFRACVICARRTEVREAA